MTHYRKMRKATKSANNSPIDKKLLMPDISIWHGG